MEDVRNEIQRSSTVCVDTNIILRLVSDPHDVVVWQLWERWHEAGHRHIAPILMRYEPSLDIVMYDDLDLYADAIDMTVRFAQPAAYDTHFLALADRFGADFYTGDQRLWNAVRHQLPWVHLVAREPTAES